ncbi:MAG: macrocin O-methyltransferase [Proteobacteria bacterium]|nr:macrocin O-methyltransferase [Pseudomonadota bacterium]NOG59106.1 macrocin O-methyltransferase [Pseudomonadota bacterium]
MINTYIRPIFNSLGVDVTRYNKYLDDFTESEIRTWNNVSSYTMTSPERIWTLIEAVKYIVKNDIEGALVECGVWKGGSAMTMALTLSEMDEDSREIFLYDTYTGMSAPSDEDVSNLWGKASDTFCATSTSEDTSDWCLSPLEEVKNNLKKTSYPQEKIRYIKGKVEDTIPELIPDKIALLRLDTDWYKSTKHELIYLFPKLSKNGILIIDDYGCWEGAKKAVDEYITENNLCLFLGRIDSSARIAVKV